VRKVEKTIPDDRDAERTARFSAGADPDRQPGTPKVMASDVRDGAETDLGRVDHRLRELFAATSELVRVLHDQNRVLGHRPISTMVDPGKMLLLCPSLKSGIRA
jgi:hypothetical protein